MLRPPPTLGRRKKDVSPTSPPEPAVPPVLTAAVFQPYDGATVTLTFDHSVDVDAYDGATLLLVVIGGQEAAVFDGTGGASPLSSTRVVVTLVQQSGPPGDVGDATLTVAAGNGIVAQGDGAAWEGVSDLPVPFEQ